MGFESPLPLVENPKIDIFWWMIWIRILFQLKVCEPCCNFWSRSIWWKISCIWWLHFLFLDILKSVSRIVLKNFRSIWYANVYGSLPRIVSFYWIPCSHWLLGLVSSRVSLEKILGLVGVSEVNFSASTLGRM